MVELIQSEALLLKRLLFVKQCWMQLQPYAIYLMHSAKTCAFVQDADRATKLVHSVETHRQCVMEVLIVTNVVHVLIVVLGTIWSSL